MRTKEEIKQEIFNLVDEYYNNFHIKKEFAIGDRINYSGRVFDSNEIKNLVDSSLDFWLTMGPYGKKFETEFAKKLGIKYCSIVNSGSSANLLAFMTLTSPLLKERQIKRGDEVITVAAGFPTTVAPIVQYGAIPVFIDVELPQYNIKIEDLDKALTDKTKAVMIAHTLGNPFNIQKIKEFCDKNNLWLIEDNCDALGSKYKYNNELKYTGTVGDIATSSFYPPHHITMGEGGAVYTNNPLLSKIIVSLRDWGRDCVCPSGIDNMCQKRFSGQHGDLPFGYDHKYVYSHFGYNLKPTDMQAAIGCEQLKKLEIFTEKRIHNFELLKQRLLEYKIDEKLILPEKLEGSVPSWFGFLLTCKKGINRNNIVPELENLGIQTRMLFAGNLIKHPCFNEMRKTKEGYKVIGDLANTDYIMNNTFWLGVYPGMTDEVIEYMAKSLKEVIDRL